MGQSDLTPRDILSSMDKMGSGAARYAEAVAGMEEFGLTVKGLLKELLRHNGVVVHTIDHRVKTEQSAKRKLSRPDVSYEGFSSLHDLLGLRITCYFSDDIDRIAGIIGDEFQVDHSRSVDKGKQLGTREFGYRSVHRVAQISANRSELAEYHRYKSLRFEIQIRTVVQHAWAEIEHDLGYKQETIPEPMSRRFSMLAGVLELVDYEFMALRDGLAKYEKEADEAVRANATDLALDLATLTAMVKHDPKVKSLDRQVAEAVVGNQKVRAAELDPKYLEKRLAPLRSVGLKTVTDVRQAIDAWEPHILDFAPRYMKLLQDNHRAGGATDDIVPGPFPQGVGLYYLWMAIGLKALTQGLLPAEEPRLAPGTPGIWTETMAAVGEAPELSHIRGSV